MSVIDLYVVGSFAELENQGRVRKVRWGTTRLGSFLHLLMVMRYYVAFMAQ